MLATRREFRPSDGLTLRDINNHIADMKKLQTKVNALLKQVEVESMSRAAAVRHAIHEMELSGFVFTPAELETWDKIARGELPFEYVREEAAQHLAEMRKRFRKNLMTMSQANNAWLLFCREEFFVKNSVPKPP